MNVRRAAAGAERLTARIARLPETTTVLVADDGVTSGAQRADAHAAHRALGFTETGLRFGKRL
jgi:hypothetical protein